MGDDALRDAVLDELGEDRLRELAGELGTDTAGARTAVVAAVDALPPEVTTAPAEGTASPGAPGFPANGSGLMSGLMARISDPVAQAVTVRTGLPRESVGRALELLLPVVLSTIARRR
jgi:hypothetical protein